MTAKRVDANQRALVELWRKMGCSVLILSSVGKGCPDVLIGCQGVNLLVEIKDGLKSPSQRKLTTDEQEFFDKWKGQVCVVKSEAEALQLIGELRKGHDSK